MSDPQTDLETLAVRTVMASFDGGTLPEWARRRLAGEMGGICLFDENGVQISLKLPCLVYAAVRNQPPSMRNFIVEAIKKAIKSGPE